MPKSWHTAEIEAYIHFVRDKIRLNGGGYLPEAKRKAKIANLVKDIRSIKH